MYVASPERKASTTGDNAATSCVGDAESGDTSATHSCLPATAETPKRPLATTAMSTFIQVIPPPVGFYIRSVVSKAFTPTLAADVGLQGLPPTSAVDAGPQGLPPIPAVDVELQGLPLIPGVDVELQGLQPTPEVDAGLQGLPLTLAVDAELQGLPPTPGAGEELQDLPPAPVQ